MFQTSKQARYELDGTKHENNNRKFLEKMEKKWNKVRQTWHGRDKFNQTLCMCFSGKTKRS